MPTEDLYLGHDAALEASAQKGVLVTEPAILGTNLRANKR